MATRKVPPGVSSGQLPGQLNPFPLTDWQRLDALRNGSEDDKRVVLGELFVRYREPILAFLRRKGCRLERAEDTVQDFFMYSIEHRLFEKADPQRGRFRNLVLKALDHFAANLHRAENAQKRRPSGGLVSMEELGEDRCGEPRGAMEDPERAFLRAWAEAMIRRVLAALSAEYASEERRAHCEIFRQLVVAPILEGAEAPSHRALAQALGLTEKEVANRLVTARRAYQRLLRAEIASYARSEEEAETEVRELFLQLSKA